MRQWTRVLCLLLSISYLGGFSYKMDNKRAMGLEKVDTLLTIRLIDKRIFNGLLGTLGEEKENETLLEEKKEIEILQEEKKDGDITDSIGRKQMKWTPMEALDEVKRLYGSNFHKVNSKESPGEYYYTLEEAEYYLFYEGIVENEYYLIHLYEFIVDEPDTGIGHTYTYGWYWVDQRTGEVIQQIN